MQFVRSNLCHGWTEHKLKILCQDLIVRYRFNVYLILSCTKLRFFCFFFLLLCWPTNVFEFWIRCYGCKVVLLHPKVNSIISYTIHNLTCVPTPFFKQATTSLKPVEAQKFGPLRVTKPKLKHWLTRPHYQKEKYKEFHRMESMDQQP